MIQGSHDGRALGFWGNEDMHGIIDVQLSVLASREKPADITARSKLIATRCVT